MVMIVAVMIDFEMTLTVDLFSVAWENSDFVYGPLKNSGERSRHILALLFSFPIQESKLQIRSVYQVDDPVEQ